MLSGKPILSDKSYNPKYKPSPSLKPIQVTPKMTDADTAIAAPLRKKLERIQSKTHRIKEQLSNQRDKEDPSSSDCESLQDIQAQLEIYKKDYDRVSEALYDAENNPTAIAEDETKSDGFEQDMMAAKMDCKQLLSKKKIHSNTQALESAVRGLNTAFDATPENNHSVALELVLVRAKDLEQELLVSTMPERDDLRNRATDILERASLIQGRVAGTKISDVKPIITASTGKSGIKLKYIDVPNFSGKTEDWLPFKRLFHKAVHNNKDLDDETRLTYLI